MLFEVITIVTLMNQPVLLPEAYHDLPAPPMHRHSISNTVHQDLEKAWEMAKAIELIQCSA